MKTLIGGAIAVAIGIIGVLVWWKSFFAILAGFIPVMLLLGGGLAIYLGFDELKDTWGKNDDKKDDDQYKSPDKSPVETPIKEVVEEPRNQRKKKSRKKKKR